MCQRDSFWVHFRVFPRVWPRVLPGAHLEYPESSLLGPQGVYFGSPGSSFAIESELIFYLAPAWCADLENVSLS